MKYFPLKAAIFCLVLTPVLYIATLNFSQKYLDDFYFRQIENVYIGDTSQLLTGRVSLEQQMADNIHQFQSDSKIIQLLGLDLNILIVSRNGKVMYPSFTDTDFYENSLDRQFAFDLLAKQNFDLLNSGIEIKRVKIDLGHGTRVANFILFFYFCIAVFIFSMFYKIGSTRAKKDAKREKELIDSLQKEELIQREILEELKKERQDLFENIKSLNAKYQKDKKKLKINEEELFDEIISLEEQLNAFIELKKNKDEEIDELKSQIKKYERRKSSKNKRNEFDFISKRFTALYKNIDMHRKAITGLLDLKEDQQIKAEECISLLNQKPEKVTIKRKVFSGKKHKTTCLEVLFAYNGRLYFKKNEHNRIQVLTIGTKNTQAKDMEFLHSL